MPTSSASRHTCAGTSTSTAHYFFNRPELHGGRRALHDPGALDHDEE
ncbi:MAG: hypothetical protein ACLP0J_04940 [Solirubrobacteraceae bacterium]